jgi:hypothetical protein
LNAAAEAKAAGYGGIAAASRVTKLARSTIGRGLRDEPPRYGARLHDGEVTATLTTINATRSRPGRSRPAGAGEARDRPCAVLPIARHALRFPRRGETLHAMCKLYSITKGQQAIRNLAGAMRDLTGNLPMLSGVLPNYSAPIVRTQFGFPAEST